MNHCKSKKAAYEVRLFDSVAALPEEWSELLPAHHFLQPDQLLLTEESHLPDLRFFYAYILNNKQPVAAAYFQLLPIQPYHADVERLSSLRRYAWYTFAKVAQPRLLVAGHLFRHDIESFFCKESLPAFEKYQCYQAAIDTAAKRSCAHAVLVKDIPHELITYFQHYAPQYIMLRNDISMEMEIKNEWETLKDYEKALKHKYAQRFRKIRQQWNTLEIRELSADETVYYRHRIFELYEQVSKKQPVRLGYLSADYLPMLKKNFPDDFHIWMAFEEEKPVAFFSAWSHKDVFDMFYIGFDYSRNEALQLYFNILFFGVEQAIHHKKSKLVLGRTALEAKARTGCKPVYLSTFLYIKNPVVRNIMMRTQQSLADNEGEWENRHPFR